VAVRDYIVAEKAISIIVAICITISRYRVTRRPSGKANGSEGDGRGGARMSYLTFDSGAGIVSATTLQ